MIHPPKSLVAAADAVRAGQCTPTQLAQYALQRMQDTRDLNAIAFVDIERAMREAEELTQEANAGKFRGPLHGVPITIKDLYNVRGMPTRAGSRAPLPRIQPDEAVAVQRLREAGALVLAKTNMVEIALGLHGENAWTGDVKNPHNPAYQTGGSSSGSAAAVASGVGYGSLGSDTAGSIRVPAAFCGIVGFKPSFGAVSLQGALPLCWSCDHAGPLAPTVADAALMFEVLVNAPLPNPPLKGREPEFAVPRAYIEGATTREMRIAFDALVQKLRNAGVVIREVALDVGDFATTFAPMRAESLSIHRHTLETQPDGFQPSVRDALMQGYSVTALDYLGALQHQRDMRAAIHAAIGDADALLLPAVHGETPLRGQAEVELEAGPKNARLAILKFSGPFAFAGVPALSLPFAKASSGLPLGVQVVTRFGEDDRALQIGAWVEAAP